ncbi:MAG: hypothetical protein CPSOU_2309 [uncultured Paraburkholderia sp.]|nr:MAG: hypothetical protein CPSOU_2309 [uncultured Paraburkholderia sp.]
MIGYIMKMERSDDGPHHFHCIFFFDGQKVQSVKYLVKKIEAYWSRRSIHVRMAPLFSRQIKMEPGE